jgi:hypothetical protein
MEKENSKELEILVTGFVTILIVEKLVWNAAIEEAVKKAHNFATFTIAAAEIRKLKV